MVDNFPPELFHEILLKLPAKSICRFRSVCKPWNLLISSEFFIASHLKRNLNSDINNHLFLKIVDDNKLDILFRHYSTSITSLPVTPFLNTRSPGIVGICQGLICFVDNIDPDDGIINIILWNPSIRKSVTLPQPSIEQKVRGMCAIGFGTDSLNNDYKVVRIVYFMHDESYIGIEVFSLRTGEWRTVEDFGLLSYLLIPDGSHASVNDRAHWVGLRNNGKPESNIIAFDMRYEVIQEISHPYDLKWKRSSDIRVSVSRGCLAVIANSLYKQQCYFKLWVMKDYGVHESWTLMFNVQELYTPFEVNRFSKSEETILIRREPNEWSIYDPKNKRVMYLELSDLGSLIYADKYEESLVLLNHKALYNVVDANDREAHS